MAQVQYFFFTRTLSLRFVFGCLEEERKGISGTRIDTGGLTRFEIIQEAMRHNLAEVVTSRMRGYTRNECATGMNRDRS